MKHSWLHTLSIILWLITAVLLGFYITPIASNTYSATVMQINQYLYAGVMLGVILLAALGWAMMMKHFKPKRIDWIFSFGLALVGARAVSLLIPALSNGPTVEVIAVRIVLITILALLFKIMITFMQKSWEWTKILSPISNIYVVFVASFAASLFGMDLAPIIALILLAGASVYDAWAVWKSKTMIKLANYFMDRRIIPGIGIPYKDEEKFALLGGGDIFFIVLVSTSFYKTSIPLMLSTAIGMVGATVLLLLFSRKTTFYPALPFIFVGAIAGLFIGVFL